MSKAMKRLKALPDPSMTIDQAIAMCQTLIGTHPKLNGVIARIKQLRDERDLLHEVASEALGSASWERSDMKKWADKQRLDPDND